MVTAIRIVMAMSENELANTKKGNLIEPEFNLVQILGAVAYFSGSYLL